MPNADYDRPVQAIRAARGRLEAARTTAERDVQRALEVANRRARQEMEQHMEDERRARLAADRMSLAASPFLSAAERAQAERGELVRVPSHLAGYAYVIPAQSGGRVQIEYDEGIVTALCLQPYTDALPLGQWIALHKLLIAADEVGYLHTANPTHRDETEHMIERLVAAGYGEAYAQAKEEERARLLAERAAIQAAQAARGAVDRRRAAGAEGLLAAAPYMRAVVLQVGLWLE